MKIKRNIDKNNATYDLIELTHKEFINLLNAYEKQMYIYCNRCPDEGTDPLLDKMRKMAELETVTI